MNSAIAKQEKIFNKYQQKILNKNIKAINKLKSNRVKGVEKLNYVDLKEGLENNITNNDFIEIKVLQDKLEKLLEEYKSTHGSLIDKTNQYSTVTGNSNKYSNKNIRFKSGHICYVTNQGIVKWIPSPEIWDSIADKRGCPTKEYIDVGIDWKPEYNNAGTIIPTDPPLLSGTPMTQGETCGNAGHNVYVNELVKNSKAKYLGCYRDKPEATIINVVPVLNSNNDKGYVTEASSLYQNSSSVDAFRAFDQNKDTFWHSEVNANYKYNESTGVYEGTTSFEYQNLTGVIETIKGEWIWVQLPNAQTVTRYEIVPRQDNGNYATRSPNSWYIMGLNPGGNWMLLDYQQNQDFTQAGKIYNIATPGSYIYYLIVTTKVGNNNTNSNRYCVQIAEFNLSMSSDSTFTNENRAMIYDGGEYVGFEECKRRALDNGYKYFGVQDVNTDGKAACLFGNDIVRTTMYGEAINTNAIPIWSSGITGNFAGVTLSSEGRIYITESGTGAEIWTSPNAPSACIKGYTYSDKYDYPGNDILSVGINGNSDDCKAKCDSDPNCGGYTTNAAKTYCWTKRVMGNMRQNSDRLSWIRQPTSQQKSSCDFTLNLQSDGNMCIYYATGGSAVWCTMTNGQQKDANPDWVASKGKYGVSYLKTGQVLAPGEWIGSDNGALKLLMQTDGNLVLYTSTRGAGCITKNDKNYGGWWTNAVYEFQEQGFPVNINKLGYLDSNGLLSEYPADMIKKTDQYKILANTDSAGNDFGGMPMQNSNVEQCKTACTSNDNCAGFVFDRTNNNCWLKNGNMYPVGERHEYQGVDTYVRLPRIENDSSCSKQIMPIDSIAWENYKKSGRNMTKDTICGLAKVTEKGINATNELKTQIAGVAKQIVDKINVLGNSTTQLDSEMEKSRTELLNNIETYQRINEEYSKNKNSYAINIGGILSDSDQLVLQENYSYMFWSILAIGLIIIIMNLKNK